MKKFKIRGFTLIELLVAVGLFGALSTIIISVLFISLRTSKKSDSIAVIKQSGDAAISQMVDKIRFARSLDFPTTCVPDVTGNKITITAFDGGLTEYGCPGVNAEGISSNSANLIDINSVKVDENSCSFTCSQISTSDSPTITIKFSLSPANATDFAENSTSISFQTAVTMRNYNR